MQAKWARAAGHPDTTVLIHPAAATVQRPAGTIISTPGGGMMPVIIINTLSTAVLPRGTLLSAYEDFSPYFDTLRTNIPERVITGYQICWTKYW